MATKAKLPKKIIKILMEWPEVYLSPKSGSYYSVPHNLLGTIGAMRISDHWNMQNGQSFKTDRDVRNGHWTLARYSGATWEVVLSCGPNGRMATITHDKLNIK